MKTLRRKVKIGIKKYEKIHTPYSPEEEEWKNRFIADLEAATKRRMTPPKSIIGKFIKNIWFPTGYEPL